MTCGQIRAQLAAYHEGGLRPSQRRAVASHLCDCPDCAASLASFDEGDRALRRFAAETPTPAIYAGVMLRMAEEAAARRRRKATLTRVAGRWLHVAGTVGAAGVVGTVLVVLAQGLHRSGATGLAAHSPAAGVPLVVGTHVAHPVPASKQNAGQTMTTRRHVLALRRADQQAGLPAGDRLVYLKIGDQTAIGQESTGAPIVQVPLFGNSVTATTLVPTPGIYSAPSVSPDGRWLAYGVHTDGTPSKNRGIWIRDAAITAKGYRMLVPHDGPRVQIKEIRWSQDGHDLIYAVQIQETVMHYAADVRRVLALLATHPIPLRVNRVYAGDVNARARIVWSYRGWAPAYNQALSPDLTLLATAGSPRSTQPDQPIVVHDLRNGRRWTVGTGARPVWSPDGTQLAYLTEPAAMGGLAAPPATLWVVAARGGTPRRLTSGPRAIDGLTWSPDGRAVALVVRGPGTAASASSQLVIVDTAWPAKKRIVYRDRWIGDVVWPPSYPATR